MNIQGIAIYSDADRTSLHVRYADEAYYIGPSESQKSYLDIERIINLAQKIKAEAIHPGYGFLAENADFAELCHKANIQFIGPPAEAIRKMGEKTLAREIMQKAGVPVVPGLEIKDLNLLKKEIKKIGLPILLKASKGGGGKGMRIVRSEEELISNYERARSEAQSSFGDPTIYVEKFIEDPRHIEVQILADTYGNVVHLFERECSIQRRYQKLVEETPTPASHLSVSKMWDVAIKAAQAVEYVNAGTIEFLVDSKGNFFFLEMNTRIQVEHPITEMTTGLDIVREQINIAAQMPLRFSQNQIQRHGHAIECRIYAESPEQNFAPSPGRVYYLRTPGGPGIREDTGIYAGMTVPMYYDPLLLKLCAWGQNRAHAIERMKRALEEYRIWGVQTNLGFHLWLFQMPEFLKGEYTTNFINKNYKKLLSYLKDPGKEIEAALSVAVISAVKSSQEVKINKTQKTQGSAWRILGRKRAMGSN
jgi:acetyl-CoA carboxylase biotin carboxylase subunit